MPYVVSAEEIFGDRGKTITITYGVFSTEDKANQAVEIFVDKLTKRQINRDHDVAYDYELIREEYRDRFLVVWVPELDNDVMFREHSPKF